MLFGLVVYRWSIVMLIDLIFSCYRAIGAGPRVSIRECEGSLRELPLCQILAMAQTRRPVIIFPMASKSFLSTTSRSWKFWWCTTGSYDFYMALPLNIQPLHPFTVLISDATVKPNILFWSICYQEILCWDSTQRLHPEEKGDCWACCSVGRCGY